MNTMTMTVIIYIAVMLFFALIVLGGYVLMRMANNLDIKYYWLGILPIVKGYIFGKIIRKINFGGIEIPHAEIICLLWPFTLVGSLLLPSGTFLSGALFNIEQNAFWAVIQLVLVFIHMMIYLYGLNTFFLMFTHSNNKALIYTFISGLTIILIPVFIFVVRNTAPIGWVGEVNVSKKSTNNATNTIKKNKGKNRAKRKRN